MMNILKQVLGVDVAQKELVVTLGRLLSDLSIELYAYKVFSNTEKGFSSLLTCTNRLTNPDIELRFVMEATGVYHQKLPPWFISHKMRNFLKNSEVKQEFTHVATPEENSYIDRAAGAGLSQYSGT